MSGALRIIPEPEHVSTAAFRLGAMSVLLVVAFLAVKTADSVLASGDPQGVEAIVFMLNAGFTLMAFSLVVSGGAWGIRKLRQEVEILA